mmetsp:Transcript_45413/g.89288  ORF Transcript_45413/g.89288 Transcript_45413/m.89288 type:complete len:251 (-) Transcript_45413:6400-7152(-)
MSPGCERIANAGCFRLDEVLEDFCVEPHTLGRRELVEVFFEFALDVFFCARVSSCVDQEAHFEGGGCTNPPVAAHSNLLVGSWQQIGFGKQQVVKSICVVGELILNFDGSSDHTYVFPHCKFGRSRQIHESTRHNNLVELGVTLLGYNFHLEDVDTCRQRVLPWWVCTDGHHSSSIVGCSSNVGEGQTCIDNTTERRGCVVKFESTPFHTENFEGVVSFWKVSLKLDIVTLPGLQVAGDRLDFQIVVANV